MGGDPFDNWHEGQREKLAAMTDAEIGKELAGVTQPSYHPGIMNLLAEAAKRLDKEKQ